MHCDNKGMIQNAIPFCNKNLKFSKIMRTFKKTKSLSALLRELPIGETICIDNRQAKTSYVRRLASGLKKEGFNFHATERGLINKIAVTKISNNN